jgi:hypothetical protein
MGRSYAQYCFARSKKKLARARDNTIPRGTVRAIFRKCASSKSESSLTAATQRDTLELSGPWTYNGEKLTFTIRLRRMP